MGSTVDGDAGQFSAGRLAYNCIDLSAAWPHGGTGLGLVGQIEVIPQQAYRPLIAEETGSAVEVLWLGGDVVVSFTAMGWDQDAMAVIFPNTDTSSSQTIVTWPGSDVTVGTPTTTVLNVVFTPWDTTNSRGFVLYKAAPLPDNARLRFSAQGFLEIPAVLIALPDGSDRLGAMGKFSELALWTPEDLSPALWFDASDSSSITKDGSNLVSQWNDKSGNAKHLTQATGSKQPLWIDGEINSRAVIEFDGTSDILVNSTAGGHLAGSSGEIWAVFKSGDVLGTGGYLIGSANEATATDFIGFRANVGGLWSFAQAATATTTDIAQCSTVIGTSDAVVVRLTSDGSTYQSFEVSGAAQTITMTAGANSGDWFADVSSRDNFTIGGLKRSSEGFPFDGQACEIVVIDGETLSTSDASLLRNYLATKWGVSLA